MGLANRVVPDGQARQAAEALVAEIARFPQRLLVDCASAYRQWDLDLAEALCAEAAGGYPVVFEEALEGAQCFVAGAGRHGRLDG